MQDFRNLKVWEKSHRLVLDIYRLTQNFPKEERYGLTSQIRRSAGSIPANIAEGCGRQSDVDFARFVQIALGSASELEYHIILAHDLNYLPKAEGERVISRIQEVKRMMTPLIRRLRTKQKTES
jgi:four helix bundle protein